MDNLWNTIWTCELMLGSSMGAMIWDRHSPSRKDAKFCDYEVGAYDGAYKGRIHTIFGKPEMAT